METHMDVPSCLRQRTFTFEVKLHLTFRSFHIY